MLLLTRRLNESLMIEDDIKVTVLGIKGHQVQLGIQAPQTTTVHREEIYQRIHAQQKPALVNTREHPELALADADKKG